MKGQILGGSIVGWILSKLSSGGEVTSSTDSGEACPYCGTEMKREYFSTPFLADGPRGIRLACPRCKYQKDLFVRRGP